MNTVNKPMIDFLGYSLSKCNFERNFETGKPVKLFIVVSRVEMKPKNVVDMVVNISISFKNESVSSFEYLSQFVVNDLQWYEKANKEHDNLAISNMFCLVFPYMRASIGAITNDSFGSITLPFINVLEGDVTKGISFITQNKE